MYVSINKNIVIMINEETTKFIPIEKLMIDTDVEKKTRKYIIDLIKTKADSNVNSKDNKNSSHDEDTIHSKFIDDIKKEIENRKNFKHILKFVDTLVCDYEKYSECSHDDLVRRIFNIIMSVYKTHKDCKKQLREDELSDIVIDTKYILWGGPCLGDRDMDSMDEHLGEIDQIIRTFFHKEYIWRKSIKKYARKKFFS
jgi:hypothetical protein